MVNETTILPALGETWTAARRKRCLNCNSGKVVESRPYRTKLGEVHKRYQCKGCGHYWIDRNVKVSYRDLFSHLNDKVDYQMD